MSSISARKKRSPVFDQNVFFFSIKVKISIIVSIFYIFVVNFDDYFDYSESFWFYIKKSIFHRNFNFSWKFQFFIKISIFHQNFNFSSKFQFFIKISIFHQNFDFFIKIPIFHKNFNFSSKFRFFIKILIFRLTRVQIRWTVIRRDRQKRRFLFISCLELLYFQCS